jgi:hypothetical protein
VVTVSAAFDECWIYAGHALYSERKIDYGRGSGWWEVYYRPYPYPKTNAAGLVGRQVLASHADKAEVRALAEKAVDAGDVRTPPDARQTEAKAASLDRERGIAAFLGDDEVAQLDVVPFRYDPRRPPCVTGLTVGRDPDGNWRTYQERFPGSTLTSGHVSNVEAYWATWAVRGICAWAVTVDLRVEPEDEPTWCGFERETLAHKVDSVRERYARWRAGPTLDGEPELVKDVKGVPALAVYRWGRGNWAVHRADRWQLVGGLGSEAKARAAAVALSRLADWTDLPPYVVAEMPALTAEVDAVKWDDTRPEWAAERRLRAVTVRDGVAAKVAEAKARRR